MNTPISLRIDPELKRELEELARHEERPLSQVAVRALRACVKAQKEHRAAIEEAMRQADEGCFISAQAIHDWMRSWDTEDEFPPPEPDIELNLAGAVFSPSPGTIRRAAFNPAKPPRHCAPPPRASSRPTWPAAVQAATPTANMRHHKR